MSRKALLVRSVCLAFLCLPAPSLAQTAPQGLEARVAELEAQLNQLRAEIVSSRAEQAKLVQAPVLLPPAPPAASPAPPVDGFKIGENTIKIGGFIKADAMVSDYNGADPANGNAMREFYLPGSIPVGGAAEGAATDFNARQTRFWITADGTIAGHKLSSRIEMDFQVLPGTGDQRTTSPSTPALRRAYVSVDKWLFGQEWSNFQNITVLPETADYIGPSEGTVFVRQMQFRYTNGNWSFSLENPDTTVSPYRSTARIVADDNVLPDLTIRYRHVAPWGEAQLAGLIHQLNYEDPATRIDDSAMGWGLSASAKVKLGALDDLRLMLTGGTGIGRYVGLNFANDAVLTATGQLEAIPLVAGFASYRHFWSPKWRSNFTYSMQTVDNDVALTGLAVNEKAQSFRANLIWTPAPGLDVGTEVSLAERTLESGLDGKLSRIHFFAKYGF